MLWYQIWFVSVAETWKQMTHKSDVQLLWTCLIDQFVCCRRSDWTWLIGWSCDIYNRPETEHFCPPHHFLCSLRKCLCVNVTSASSSVSLGPRSGLHCFSAAGRPLGCLFGNRWRPASVAARCNRRGESDVSEQDGLCFSQTVVVQLWRCLAEHQGPLQFFTVFLQYGCWDRKSQYVSWASRSFLPSGQSATESSCVSTGSLYEVTFPPQTLLHLVKLNLVHRFRCYVVFWSYEEIFWIYICGIIFTVFVIFRSWYFILIMYRVLSWIVHITTYNI